MRSVIKTGVAHALHSVGADRLVGSLAVSRRVPLVVCYHTVVENLNANSDAIPAMLVSRHTLERHLDWLSGRFQIVSLDELGGRPARVRGSDRPEAAVTFDDGYRDVYHHALPLLKRKGIPAAIFVVTDLLGTAELQIHDEVYLLLTRALRKWRSAPLRLTHLLLKLGVRSPAADVIGRNAPDHLGATRALLTMLPQTQIRRLIRLLQLEITLDDSALESFRPLTWEMVSEMHRAGMTIGSHTRSHALLTNESPKKVVDEAVESRQVLEEKLGTKIRHFAYPDGRFNAAAVRAVAAAGYKCAYTTCQHRDAEYPWLTIPRRPFWENSCRDMLGHFSPAIMSCHVNGVFDWAARCRQIHAFSF